ncbi:hypothetical protein [Persephonella sp.]|uniref:hypothetical protein n=1 Tax=Persephonella sp. TaxID=2060922 RepID=UPI00262E50FA|nr:hypothetical protein [Persephonella sp.]
MRKHLFRYSLSAGILTASIFVSSCFDSSNGGRVSIPKTEPPTQEEENTITQATISGSVDSGGINTQAVGDAKPALITALSIDKNGKEIGKSNTIENNGYFGVSVPISKDGGKIVISVNKDGFTQGTQTIEYSSPDDVRNLNIVIPIKPVEKQLVNLGNINLASVNNNSVRIRFYKDSNGKIKSQVVREISTQSQENTVMELAIPVSKLQANNSSVVEISYKGFTPSNPEDYKNFPGEEYAGGGKLISFGFDWLDIKDPTTGNNPLAQGNISPQLAKKDLGEYFRIYRSVDCDQLRKLKKSLGTLDIDPHKEGIQYVFYAFDRESGNWLKAGEGVFVNGSTAYYEIGEDNDKIDTAWDYIIKNGCINDDSCSQNSSSSACVDVDNDGTPEDVSCSGNNIITDENQICASGGKTYVVVSSTNPYLSWKNLDYIKPASKILECEITVKDEDGNPVATNIYVEPDNNNCISAWYGVSSAKGKADANVLKFCDPPKGTVNVFNPYTRQYISNTKEITFGPGCKITLTLKNPYKCMVEGKVVSQDTGSGRKNVGIQLKNDQLEFYAYTTTDQNGEFIQAVPCNADIQLYAYDKSLQFNVNGVLESNETQDNGKNVILKDIKIINIKPNGYGEVLSKIIKAGSDINTRIYGWDPDGNYPINYTITLKLNGTTVKTVNGQLFGSEENVKISTNDISNDGIYKLYLSLEDSEGGKSQEIYMGSVQIYVNNAAPQILSFYTNPKTAVSTAIDINVIGSAYDLEGENLTYTISYDCEGNGQYNQLATGSGQGNIKFDKKFNIPNNATECKLKLEVNDTAGNTSIRKYVLKVKDEPPVVYISAYPEHPNENDSRVYVDTSIYEPDGQRYTCEWYVNGNKIQDNDPVYEFEFGDKCEGIIIHLDQMNPKPKTGDEFNVKIEVTDETGNKVDKEITIDYGKSANINIGIQ